jgi:hypothetical protein
MVKPPRHSARSPRPLCPICHRATYSRGGVHPQCAAARGEAAERKSRLQAELVGPVAREGSIAPDAPA